MTSAGTHAAPPRRRTPGSRASLARARLAFPLLLPLLSAIAPATAPAQHEGHDQPPAPANRRKAEASGRRLFQSDMSVMAGMTPEDAMSGGSSPGWQWMSAGVARLAANHQGGRSGDDAVESSNWSMVMAHRRLGPGRLTLMLMSSLEPATLPDRGSPQLLQTGETFAGEPLVDRQHAHDFFGHLSATWRAALSPQAAFWIQLAPVGEPALGPGAYLHRASAGDNPTAPLGHHWQDSSHITRNVLTAGGGWRWLTLESSVFHGAEPDEGRWDIDGGRLDSAAGRLKLGLAAGWSAELSHGYLHEPEALEEGDTHRTTASLHYGAAGDGPFAATFLWGRNDEEHGTSDAFLIESACQVTRRDQAYARFERVEKDLALLSAKELPAAGEENELAAVTAFTLGYLRDFDLVRGLATGLGGDITVHGLPARLDSAYGDVPVSAHVFFRLRWGGAHAQHGGDGGGRHGHAAHSGQDAAPEGLEDRLGLGMDVQLLVDVPDVEAQGVLAQVEGRAVAVL